MTSIDTRQVVRLYLADLTVSYRVLEESYAVFQHTANVGQTGSPPRRFL